MSRRSKTASGASGWNALQIAYARALNGCGRWRDTVRFLEGVEVLPSEFGDNACDIWQEARKNLGDEKMAATYPENLGKGAPYPRIEHTP